MTVSRRDLIKATLLGAGGLALASKLPLLSAARAQVAVGNIPEPGSVSGPVTAILPRGKGHNFVWMGDCTSGIPGARHEKNFAAVNKLLLALDPEPDHLVFLGDDIMGYTNDEAELRGQWKHFLGNEFTFRRDRDVPTYHMGSNHNTYNPMAEQVFRDVFPDFPKNGPLGQEGISYWVRRGDLLYVVANTSYTMLGGDGHVETEWLDKVLAEHADARHKIVCGHHPAFPVNGYANLSAVDPEGFIAPAMRASIQPGGMPYFRWHIVDEDARAFWNVLVRHGVTAYICSHIILYDVQIHDGVLQICTSGAGTNWGPDGMMPGATEYYHVLQGALDSQGLRYQVLDTDGRAREWLRWPFELPQAIEWEPLPDGSMPSLPKPAAWDNRPDAHHLLAFSVRGALGAGGEDQTLVCGWDDQEGGHIFWLGLVGSDHKLEFRMIPRAGHGAQVWRGPALGSGGTMDLEFLVHTGWGPGGIMARDGKRGPWTSLGCTASKGAERMAWPARFGIGQAISGPDHMPFRGRGLDVRWHVERIEQDRTA